MWSRLWSLEEEGTGFQQTVVLVPIDGLFSVLGASNMRAGGRSGL